MRLSLLTTALLCAQSFAGSQTVQVCTNGATVAPNPGMVQLDVDAGAIAGTIDSITVDAVIDTGWVGDVALEIVHNGTTLAVLDQVTWQTHPFGCGGDNINATFTDAVTTLPESLCDNSTEPMLFGDLEPAQAFTGFNGGDPGGAWSFILWDLHAFDTVTAQSLCVNITYTAAPACDGDANGDLVVDVNDISYVLFRLGDPPPDGDANGDGSVDVNDVSYVLFRLGNC